MVTSADIFHADFFLFNALLLITYLALSLEVHWPPNINRQRWMSTWASLVAPKSTACSLVARQLTISHISNCSNIEVEHFADGSMADDALTPACTLPTLDVVCGFRPSNRSSSAIPELYVIFGATTYATKTTVPRG